MNTTLFYESNTLHNTSNTLATTKRLSDTFTNIILVLYTLIFIFGIVGNIFACAVVIFKHTMRRSIHFYTCNLSISDIIILLVYAPTQMRFINDHLNWTMGKFTCKLANFVIPLSLQASVCTLVAISIDRFRGVVYPFSWRADSIRNSKFIIPLTWIFSIGIAFPTGFYATTVQHPNNTDLVICWENLPERRAGETTFQLTYWTIVMVLEYILPFIIIAIVHIYMARRIATGGKGVSAFHRRMMIMVIVLLSIYLVCTGMQHIYFYIVYFNTDFGKSSAAGYLYVISNLLIVLQAAINPMIYCTTRSDFKDAYKELIKNILSATRMRFLLKKSSHSVERHTDENQKPKTINVTPLLIQKLERDLSESQNNKISLEKLDSNLLDNADIESEQEDIAITPSKRNFTTFNRLNSIQTALKISHAKKFKFTSKFFKTSDSCNHNHFELLEHDIAESYSSSESN